MDRQQSAIARADAFLHRHGAAETILVPGADQPDLAGIAPEFRGSLATRQAERGSVWVRAAQT